MAAPTGYTQLVANNIQDGSTNLLPSGTLTAIPTDATDTPINAIAGGAGGPIATSGAVFPIANGVVGPTGLKTGQTWAGIWSSVTAYPAGSVVSKVSGTTPTYYLAASAASAGADPAAGTPWTSVANATGPFLADTALTNPANLCWRFVIQNAVGQKVYTVKKVQFAEPPTPTATFNLDLNSPPASPQTPYIKGPKGDPGADGAPGAPGAGVVVTSNGAEGNFAVTNQLSATSYSSATTYLTSSGTVIPGETRQMSLTRTYAGPGYNVGAEGGWEVLKGYGSNHTFLTRGISQALNLNKVKNAVGDVGVYIYLETDAGSAASADEGFVGLSLEVSESSAYFHGTIAATSGTGDTQPSLNFSSGQQATTDGAFLLNISKGTLAGNLNGASSPVGSATYNGYHVLNALPVTGVSLPITSALGLCTTVLTFSNKTRDVRVSQTLTVTLQAIGGSTPAFVAGGIVGIAGAYPEQAPITAVGAVSGGTQTITVALSNPQPGPFYVFQGGLVGQYLSFDANLALSGMRSSYFVFGSLTGSDLIYGVGSTGSIGRVILPQLGLEAATQSGSGSGFHLYPGAEIVCNFIPAQAAQGTPGQPGYVAATSFVPAKLETNAVAWAAGDLVENPHYPVNHGFALPIRRNIETPATSYLGGGLIQARVSGHGVNKFVKLLEIANDAPQNIFKQYGGPIDGPPAVTIEGPIGSGITFAEGPPPGVPLINMQNNAGNVASSTVTGITPLIALPAPSAGFFWSPSTDTFGMSRLNVNTLTSGPVTITSGSGITQSGGTATFDSMACNHIVGIGGNAPDATISNLAIIYDITSVRDVYAIDKIYAQNGFVAGGTAGFTGDIAVGSVTLHVKGGLITGFN